ncbi:MULTISPECIES: PleD family two-component system response regulator [Acaryochloris]|uniref:Response regulator receiver, putative n=1 Tax=Acaryochloris marina (strain MBIC 11017) TaxID=329726 RepID=B0BZM5_ACAM1|nr:MULTISPECIES: response regulator [Acaryochloris]ABW25951.1 response regulator receiver, putative [Acaryochloris marina MBIC11017]KAI9131082.1 response regulator [Acaryochloris sp. CCMEE 5410]BDM80805.1 response regulator [Acaryochloris marina MBIC10699]
MRTVLVVDDGPAELELICSYLREGGYTVISTTDAKDALAKAESQKPDLVVTDVVMPGMSGFELCRSLKKNEATQQLPVVICTSKNQDLDKLWGKKQGADAYVTKPFTREDLLQAVQSVV